MEYYRPRDIDELLKVISENPCPVFIAGGTDIAIPILEGIRNPGFLIDLTLIQELQKIHGTENEMSIGAAVTMKQLSDSDSIPACLTMGAGSVGSPQIRNLATLGGNICNASPCGDTLPGLLVMDSELQIISPSGVRNVKAADFFTGPKATVLTSGEVVKEIHFSKKYLSGYSGFSKIGKRSGQIISQVNAAVWFDLNPFDQTVKEIRIAAGSVAPTPILLKKLESFLSGKKIDKTLYKEIRELAGQEISPIDDVRASEKYRRDVMGALIIHALESAKDISGNGIGENR